MSFNFFGLDEFDTDTYKYFYDDISRSNEVGWMMIYYDGKDKVIKIDCMEEWPMPSPLKCPQPPSQFPDPLLNNNKATKGE